MARDCEKIVPSLSVFLVQALEGEPSDPQVPAACEHPTKAAVPTEPTHLFEEFYGPVYYDDDEPSSSMYTLKSTSCAKELRVFIWTVNDQL